MHCSWGCKNKIAEMRVVEMDWEGERTCLASLRDITERKRMHEELEQTRQQQLQLKINYFPTSHTNSVHP